MANIDLKILFGVDVRDSDFERVNQQLGKIQDNANRLNEAFNRAGAQGTSGFSRFAEQFSSMGRIQDAIKNVNQLSASIETLTKTQGGLLGLMRTMSELGRSINDSMGESKTRLMRQYSNEVDALRTASQSKMQQSGIAQRLADNAAAMGNDEMAQRFRNIASQRGVEAGQAMDAYNFNRYMRPVIQAGASALRIGGAAAVMATLPGQLADSYENFASFAPVRGQIAMQNYNMSAATDAARGQVTSFALRNLGVGLEQQSLNNFSTQLRDAAVIVGRFSQGLIGSIPLVGGLLGGGRSYQTVDSLFAERMMERRGLDKGLYGPLFDAAGDLMLERTRTFGGLYRGNDVNGINRIILEANRHGISDALLAPIANITAARGLDFSQTWRTALHAQTLGLDPSAVDQMVRLSSRGNAGGIMSAIMGATGVNTFGGASMASAMVGDTLSRATGGFNGNQVTQLLTNAINGAIQNRGELPETEVIGPAGAAASGLLGMSNSPGNFVSAGIDMSLINMGVRNPVLRTAISTAVSQGKFSEAARAIAAARGLSGNSAAIASARRSITSVFGSYLDTVGGMGGTSPADTAAFGEIDTDPTLMLMTGQTARSGAVGGLRKGLDQIGAGEYFAGQPKVFGGPELGLEAGMAQRQANIMAGVQKVTDDLGKGILNEIATGFRTIGLNIATLANKTKEQLDQVKATRKPDSLMNSARRGGGYQNTEASRLERGE